MEIFTKEIIGNKHYNIIVGFMYKVDNFTKNIFKGESIYENNWSGKKN